MVDLLIPRRLDSADELASILESLPSYDNLAQNSDEDAVFDDDQEPSSGLINLIRKNSLLEETPTDSSNTVGLIS
jgi:hypothetical protein